MNKNPRQTGTLHGTTLPAQDSAGLCRQPGFTLLELVVVIAIVAGLITLAINKLLVLQGDAERVAMESVAGAVRSGLGIKVAEHIVKQDISGLAAYTGKNPMDLLAQLPMNYLGELDGVDPNSLEPGNWYFDSRSRSLVYLVNNRGRFSGGGSSPARARFAVRVAYTDKNGNRVYDPGVDAIEGLKLEAVEPYAWTH